MAAGAGGEPGDLLRRNPLAHGERGRDHRLGEIRPATTLVEAKLIGGCEVEIEVEPVVG